MANKGKKGRTRPSTTPTERRRGKMSRRKPDATSNGVRTVKGFVEKANRGQYSLDQMSKGLQIKMNDERLHIGLRNDDPTKHSYSGYKDCTELVRLKESARIASKFRRKGARELYGILNLKMWLKMVNSRKTNAVFGGKLVQPTAKEKRINRITGLPYKQIRELVRAEKI